MAMVQGPDFQLFKSDHLNAARSWLEKAEQLAVAQEVETDYGNSYVQEADLESAMAAARLAELHLMLADHAREQA